MVAAAAALAHRFRLPKPTRLPNFPSSKPPLMPCCRVLYTCASTSWISRLHSLLELIILS